jgi:1-acyl-sn-glycerol-3-phosphate acyltransferase
MSRVLKVLFFVVVKIVVLLIIGLQIRHLDRLPKSGAAIIVANHNSHLDTLILMSLFSLSMLHNIRPVADEQYFLHQNRGLAWFATQVLNIIPVARESLCHRTFRDRATAALGAQQMLILYPEGTRGEPETLATLHSGIAHLAKHHPQVPIIPVFLHGAGKALPKGEWLMVPFICWVLIGEPLYWSGSKPNFMQELRDRFASLSTEESLPTWD